MSKAPRRRSTALVSSGNLYSLVPAKLKQEQFDELIATDAVRIERILSRGQACGADEWYDEEEAEWVVVLSGSARLQIEGEAELRRLEAGDYVYIPPRTRHRVDWTDPDQTTVWLAIHFR